MSGKSLDFFAVGLLLSFAFEAILSIQKEKNTTQSYFIEIFLSSIKNICLHSVNYHVVWQNISKQWFSNSSTTRHENSKLTKTISKFWPNDYLKLSIRKSNF